MRLARALIVGLLIGAVLGVILGLVSVAGGVVAVVVVVVLVVALGAWMVPRYYVPRLCRLSIEKQVDPGAGPPAGTVPVEPDLARRLATALTERDWPAARALLSPDCAVRLPQRARRGGAGTYVRGARMMAAAHPHLRIDVDEVVGLPGEPEQVWVRFSEVGRPRRGPRIEATWWEHWTLTPDGDRLREMELVGVTRLS
jgi:hypothetical protein